MLFHAISWKFQCAVAQAELFWVPLCHLWDSAQSAMRKGDRGTHIEVLLILLCLCSTNNVGSAMDCDGLHSFHDLPCIPRYSKPFPTLPRLAQCGVPFRRADAQVLEGDPRQACRVNLWLVTCDMNIMNCLHIVWRGLLLWIVLRISRVPACKVSLFAFCRAAHTGKAIRGYKRCVDVCW